MERSCERTIYDLPIGKKQIARELRNSLHAPIHAVILAAFLYLGFFKNTSFVSFLGTALVATAWAEHAGTTARIAPFTSRRCIGFTSNIT